MPKTKSPPRQNAQNAQDSAGSEREYQRFLPKARALPAERVVPFRADVQLANYNVQVGVTSVMAERVRLRAALREVDVKRLEELPNVSLAVLFAASQVDRRQQSTGEIGKDLARAHVLRGLLLSSADALSVAGVVPAAALAKIKKGHGAIDAASDCVALAALFRKHASQVRGKSAVTAANVKECAELGTRLLGVLKPTVARNKTVHSAEMAEAIDARNRLWTLLVEGHDALWRAGAYLFGRSDVDARVPPLQARAAASRSRKKGEPVAPAPAPSAAS